MNKKALKSIVLVPFLLFAWVSTQADILNYEWTGNGYRRVSREKAPGADEAFVCKNGTCVIYCGVCHAQQPSEKKYTPQEQQRHFDTYHAKSEVAFRPDEQIEFGGLRLSRQRDRIAAVDNKGARHLMPAGAKLLKNKRGEPEVIVYRGSVAPW